MKIGHRQNVGDAQGLRDVTLALHGAHSQRIAANTVCAFGQAQVGAQVRCFIHGSRS
jgi:hypothetical protein